MNSANNPLQCFMYQEIYVKRNNYRREYVFAKKSYSCDFCGKTFSRKSNRDAHHKRHIEKNTYECDICKRVFRQKWNLRRHLDIHTGERPHKCPTCGRAFIRICTMKSHMRTHVADKPPRDPSEVMKLFVVPNFDPNPSPPPPDPTMPPRRKKKGASSGQADKESEAKTSGGQTLTYMVLDKPVNRGLPIPQSQPSANLGSLISKLLPTAAKNKTLQVVLPPMKPSEPILTTESPNVSLNPDLSLVLAPVNEFNNAIETTPKLITSSISPAPPPTGYVILNTSQVSPICMPYNLQVNDTAKSPVTLSQSTPETQSVATIGSIQPPGASDYVYVLIP